jgi:diacylglycerol kinase (ATP)
MFSERKILLVVNPISGDMDKDDIYNIIINRAEEEGLDLRIYSTDGKRDQETIKQMVENIQPERVIVAGGDGTISLVAQAVFGLNVILCILPAGSANGLSVDFGIPANLADAVNIAFGENTIGVDAVSINGEISLHLSDIGLNALLVKNYENGETRGKMGYAREMLRTLNEHENFLVRITTDQEVIETEALIVIIANAQKYGTGVNINPMGNMSDGLFELVIAKRLDFIETAKILTGNTDLNPDIMKIISVDKAEIECLDREVYFQIDGEYKGTVRKLETHIIPNYIRVAIP